MGLRLRHQLKQRQIRPRARKALVLELAERADAHGEHISTTIHELAAVLGCAERTVQRHLHFLLDIGFVERTQTSCGRAAKTEMRINMAALTRLERGAPGKKEISC
jgi:MarR-like DNA-binding transcriptional regulator SgrR of sgrS sRNA